VVGRCNHRLAERNSNTFISDKFNINIPYMRMFYAKEMALDRINGPWNESF
jgi:hypothetical protein